MKQERYAMISQLIEKGHWLVNAERGEVRGRRGSTGYVDQAGYRRLTALYEGSQQIVGAHEIIMVAKGHDLTDKEIRFKDENRLNARYDNLEIAERGTAAREALLKRGGCAKDRIGKEQAQRVKDDLKAGLSKTDTALRHNIPVRTVCRIAKGQSFKTLEQVTS